MHQALSELLASIQADQSTMANALKSTCQQMGGGSVWGARLTLFRPRRNLVFQNGAEKFSIPAFEPIGPVRRLTRWLWPRMADDGSAR